MICVNKPGRISQYRQISLGIASRPFVVCTVALAGTPRFITVTTTVFAAEAAVAVRYHSWFQAPAEALPSSDHIPRGPCDSVTPANDSEPTRGTFSSSNRCVYCMV